MVTVTLMVWPGWIFVIAQEGWFVPPHWPEPNTGKVADVIGSDVPFGASTTPLATPAAHCSGVKVLNGRFPGEPAGEQTSR